MVWGLFPADHPLSGEDKYYIFQKGTYKVGRKGCDVIINKDKGVSRIHAEILVDAMTSFDHRQKKSSNKSSNVRIRDCSKYGTYINKNLGSKENVHEFPNKETTLRDGDLVSFGTGKATYRFCFVPLVFFVCCSEPVQTNQILLDKIQSIGASVTDSWSPECTHVLADCPMSLKEDLVDAVVARKPVVSYSWIEFLTEKDIYTDFPSCSCYIPSVMLEGLSVKVVDPQSREYCLRGYTFLLDSTHKYKLKEKLQSLLEVAGAKVVSIEGFCPNSEGLEEEKNDHMVHVIPAGVANVSACIPSDYSLARVTEINLISAALSGRLDPSVIVSPPVLVTSSCSTEETIVADSDVEVETATSSHATIEHQVIEGRAVKEIDSIEHTDDLKNLHIIESSEQESKEGIAADTKDFIEPESKREVLIDRGFTKSESDRDVSMTATRDKLDEPESGNSDILYSQNLVVRDTNVTTSVGASTGRAVLNFKNFRKTRTQSGNSFGNLIPFSKYPYKDSDYGSEEVIESIKEEKKRKQMEAVAEDLFNNEKGRRRSVAGSLHGLFARS